MYNMEYCFNNRFHVYDIDTQFHNVEVKVQIYDALPGYLIFP